MLTRFFRASVASNLTETPGAASFHSGCAGNFGGWTTVVASVSWASLCSTRSHKDVDGRSTSVGHDTKEPMMGRSVSNSCLQSAQAMRCAFTAEISFEGKDSSAYRNTKSKCSSLCGADFE